MSPVGIEPITFVLCDESDRDELPGRQFIFVVEVLVLVLDDNDLYVLREPGGSVTGHCNNCNIHFCLD